MVVFEVVASEIGEERDVEFNAGYPVLVEPDRGHLHRHRLRAATRKLGQLRVQPYCIGCGVGDGLVRRAQSVPERSDHRAFAAGARQGLCDPLTARGLAVGASYADHLEPGAGTAVDATRNLAGVTPERV